MIFPADRTQRGPRPRKSCDSSTRYQATKWRHDTSSENGRASRPFFAKLLPLSLVLVAALNSARAAECAFEVQGEGRVTAVIDARSFRLEDGREVRLSGLESADKAKGTAALSALVIGRDVTLRGEDDAPDRYGRQPAFAFLAGSEHSVQSELLRQGQALVSADVTNKDCASSLLAAEAEARREKMVSGPTRRS